MLFVSWFDLAACLLLVLLWFLSDWLLVLVVLLLALVADECGFVNGFVSWLIVELVTAGWVCVRMFVFDLDICLLWLIVLSYILLYLVVDWRIALCLNVDCYVIVCICVVSLIVCGYDWLSACLVCLLFSCFF